MSLNKKICLFLLVLVAVAPASTIGVWQDRTEAVLQADGGAPEPPPIPIPWPWLV